MTRKELVTLIAKELGLSPDNNLVWILDAVRARNVAAKKLLETTDELARVRRERDEFERYAIALRQALKSGVVMLDAAARESAPNEIPF